MNFYHNENRLRGVGKTLYIYDVLERLNNGNYRVCMMDGYKKWHCGEAYENAILCHKSVQTNLRCAIKYAKIFNMELL